MNTKHTKIEEQNSCFSEQHFEKVYTHVLQHPDLAKRGFVAMEGLEISIAEVDRLVFKKEGYSMGMALKNKGIIALAKRQPDNERNKKAIEHAFCLLLENAQ